ncbi:pyrroline-5-carboxylate reductase [Shewanella sp. OPT22]|nr:pyrroline-5-carboxylate reductase [Shewanella sp. OPT22]
MRLKYVLFSLILAAVSGSAFAKGFKVEDVWIRAMPPTSRVVPIYLTIENSSQTPMKLMSISSNRGHVELHKSFMKKGMMRMEQVEFVAVPANGAAKLEPESFHGMMMDFTHGVPAKGEKVPLTLHFKNGKNVKVTARVTADGPAIDHSHHH